MLKSFFLPGHTHTHKRVMNFSWWESLSRSLFSWLDGRFFFVSLFCWSVLPNASEQVIHHWEGNEKTAALLQASSPFFSRSYCRLLGKKSYRVLSFRKPHQATVSIQLHVLQIFIHFSKTIVMYFFFNDDFSFSDTRNLFRALASGRKNTTLKWECLVAMWTLTWSSWATGYATSDRYGALHDGVIIICTFRVFFT